MAEQAVTLRITANAARLVTGVGLAKKEVASLGAAGQTSGQQIEAGMGSARRGVQSISQSLKGAKDQILSIGKAYVTIQGARALAGLADSWSDMTSRVRLNIDATESASDVMDRLSSIARGTYSSIELTTESFARNAVTCPRA